VVVAITIGQERISPVFEAGERLLLLEVERHSEISRREVRWPDAITIHRIEYLKSLRVEVVICGGVMGPTEAMLQQSGLRVISWVCGETDMIVKAFLQGILQREQYRMPGCCRHRRRSGETQRRGGRRQGRVNAGTGTHSDFKSNSAHQPFGNDTPEDQKTNRQSQTR
jgi:predicted Fe-Mo cluster-binding NifX family protein